MTMLLTHLQILTPSYACQVSIVSGRPASNPEGCDRKALQSNCQLHCGLQVSPHTPSLPQRHPHHGFLGCSNPLVPYSTPGFPIMFDFEQPFVSLSHSMTLLMKPGRPLLR
ncbi:hypothetical protein F5X99DRAFT_373958 [Biscogniauxia marginata]|nr:hypothetical protein F5X99DRAFT_373958 [Biscogniauxia marginata]